MICVNGTKECDGCMMCQEPKVVLKSDEGEPIYEGDTYFDIGGMIVTQYELEQFRKIAGE